MRGRGHGKLNLRWKAWPSYTFRKYTNCALRVIKEMLERITRFAAHAEVGADGC